MEFSQDYYLEPSWASGLKTGLKAYTATVLGAGEADRLTSGLIVSENSVFSVYTDL
ncbi:hypothetical protein I79_023441 [Cricetulus griseus]|uniref:Uncharacterized protein n=1 Tax=Cricetulus griseus TaxID=10029 RepID=G3IHY1_CRIGR|nr:hypothetical protein I79_023441 [Cricetulus griseus]